LSPPRSKQVKPKNEPLARQPADFRPGLLIRRPRLNQLAVKPGKTNLTDSPDWSGPVKAGKTKNEPLARRAR